MLARNTNVATSDTIDISESMTDDISLPALRNIENDFTLLVSFLQTSSRVIPFSFSKPICFTSDIWKKRSDTNFSKCILWRTVLWRRFRRLLPLPRRNWNQRNSVSRIRTLCCCRFAFFWMKRVFATTSRFQSHSSFLLPSSLSNTRCPQTSCVAYSEERRIKTLQIVLRNNRRVQEPKRQWPVRRQQSKRNQWVAMPTSNWIKHRWV